MGYGLRRGRRRLARRRGEHPRFPVPQTCAGESPRGGALRYVTDGRSEPAEDAEPGSWAEDRGPDWSPDGRRIAFTRHVWLCPRCDQDEIYSCKLDGSDVVGMASDTDVSESPSWSPDSRFFVAATSDGLKIFTAAGKVERKLPRPGSAPAWQPLRR